MTQVLILQKEWLVINIQTRRHAIVDVMNNQSAQSDVNQGHGLQRLKIEIPASAVIKTISLLFAAYIIFLLRDIFVILLTAVVVASAIEPITLWFKKHFIERVFAVIIIYLTTAIVMFGIIYFFIPSLVTQIQEIISQFPSYLTVLQQDTLLNNSSESTGILSSIQRTVPLDQVFGNIQSTSQAIFAAPGAIIGAIFGGLLSMVIIIVVSFYLAVQEDGVSNFLRVITPKSYESYVIDLWKRTQKKIGAWLQGQLILSVIVGTLSFIGLTILGVPNALLLALLAAAFELIPLFGPILASIPAILIGFIQGDIKLGLAVAALYLVIQQLENHIFHPIVVKKVVGVPAIIVIIAMLIGAQLAGFLGIILAVPLAAGLMELVSDIEKFKSNGLSDDIFGFTIDNSADSHQSING